jgi:hypothetical protein
VNTVTDIPFIGVFAAALSAEGGTFIGVFTAALSAEGGTFIVWLRICQLLKGSPQTCPSPTALNTTRFAY